MHRFVLALSLLIALSGPSLGQGIADYDCSSDLDGPYTPAGTLRVENQTKFAFLDTATALPGKYHKMELVDGERVEFGPAFADHISPGAIMVEASYFADAYAFEAAIMTVDGRVVMVSCPYYP